MKSMPPILTDHILPFDWDVQRVWELEAEISVRPLVDFDYLLDLPLWSSVPNQGMLFDISPREVLQSPGKSPHQYRRILDADIGFPIDLVSYRERLWILDGVHRLAKLSMTGAKVVSLRLHPETIISGIAVES